MLQEFVHVLNLAFSEQLLIKLSLVVSAFMAVLAEYEAKMWASAPTESTRRFRGRDSLNGQSKSILKNGQSSGYPA